MLDKRGKEMYNSNSKYAKVTEQRIQKAKKEMPSKVFCHQQTMPVGPIVEIINLYYYYYYCVKRAKTVRFKKSFIVCRNY